jgi:hypothetical protein
VLWVGLEILHSRHPDALAFGRADRVVRGVAQGRAEIAAVEPLAQMRAVGVGIDEYLATDRLPDPAKP